jgi:cyclophilin family peptidyl-prolyl cis-trans isomerase
MARTQVIDSATSQFFINVVNNDFLNYRDPSFAGFGYCVFGEVTEGMDVVDQIKAVKTGNVSDSAMSQDAGGNHRNRPLGGIKPARTT